MTSGSPLEKITAPKQPARERVKREDFDSAEEWSSALRVETERDIYFQKLREHIQKGDLGGLILERTLGLLKAKEEVGRALENYNDEIKRFIGLSRILEDGGRLVISPTENQELEVFSSSNNGYLGQTSLLYRISDVTTFEGSSMEWETFDDGVGHVKLYRSDGSGTWVNLTFNEQDEPNFVIQEVLLPELVEE